MIEDSTMYVVLQLKLAWDPHAYNPLKTAVFPVRPHKSRQYPHLLLSFKLTNFLLCSHSPLNLVMQSLWLCLGVFTSRPDFLQHHSSNMSIFFLSSFFHDPTFSTAGIYWNKIGACLSIFGSCSPSLCDSMQYSTLFMDYTHQFNYSSILGKFNCACI